MIDRLQDSHSNARYVFYVYVLSIFWVKIEVSKFHIQHGKYQCMGQVQKRFSQQQEADCNDTITSTQSQLSSKMTSGTISYRTQTSIIFGH